MGAALSGIETRLCQRLEEALARHGVPGAAVGISIDDERAVVTAGIASLRTRALVTPESLFAIGSVTKIYQAGLLLSLGLNLDDPVQRHLPEFGGVDAEAIAAITIRDLLTHSSGLAGDHFPELGWGDDAIRLFVESCASLGQTHPPGLLTSYCNTGVNVGGRIVETVDCSTWDDALRDRLLTPAGLERTVSLPWQAVLHEIAAGHLPGDDGLVVAPTWSWPRATSPCGGTLAASAGDVLRFARLHLDGLDPIGSEVAQAMAEFQRPWPEGLASSDGARMDGMGLGWQLHDWSGTRVLGHDGAGLGCAAALRVIPTRNAAVVCLANSWHAGSALVGEVVRGALEDECGLVAPPIEVARNPFPPGRYVGTYERFGARLQVTERPAGRLTVRYRRDPYFIFPTVTAELELEPIGPDLFRIRDPQHGRETTYRFVEVNDSKVCDYLYEGIRAGRRVS